MEDRPRQESDEVLMSSLAAGRDDALDLLIRRWEHRLRCFLARMGGPRIRVDELCQEIWTRLYLYRARYDGDRPFAPLLFTIAVNCCRTAMSAGGAARAACGEHGRAAEVGDGPLAEIAATDEDDPLAEMISAEQRSSLRRAIARLPDAQRAVVLLYLLCDSDYARIASILGRSGGTVRSQMHHALRTLRVHLERSQEGPGAQALREEADYD